MGRLKTVPRPARHEAYVVRLRSPFEAGASVKRLWTISLMVTLVTFRLPAVPTLFQCHSQQQDDLLYSSCNIQRSFSGLRVYICERARRQQPCWSILLASGSSQPTRWWAAQHPNSPSASLVWMLPHTFRTTVGTDLSSWIGTFVILKQLWVSLIALSFFSFSFFFGQIKYLMFLQSMSKFYFVTEWACCW